VEADSPISASYILSYYDAFQGSDTSLPSMRTRYLHGFNSPYCTAVSEDAAIGSVPLWSSSPELPSYYRRRPRIPLDMGWLSRYPKPLCEQHSSVQYLERDLYPANWPIGAPNVDVDEFDSADTNCCGTARRAPAPIRRCSRTGSATRGVCPSPGTAQSAPIKPLLAP